MTSLVTGRLDFGNSVLYDLPAVQLRRLQSVQNAAARLVFSLRRSDSISDALICLHWLRVPERIRFKLAVLTYWALRGEAHQYLPTLRCVADIPGRRGLRSANTTQLLIPRIRLATVGSRSFSVAAPTIWNSLPHDVTSAPSTAIFRSRLKTFLLCCSFPGVVV